MLEDDLNSCHLTTRECQGNYISAVIRTEASSEKVRTGQGLSIDK